MGTPVNIYDIDSVTTLSVSFDVTSNSSPVDPTTVSLVIKAPDGTVTTVTPTRISTGVYSYNLSLVEAGYYYYKFYGTGNLTASDDGTLFVRESPTLTP